MAAILPFLKSQPAFDPETLQTMSKAFDDVCEALRLKPSETKGREAVAKKIIEMARQGEQDPARLCERVLRAAGITEWSAREPNQRPMDGKRYSAQ